MFPYLDRAGFKRRSVMADGDVDALEQLYPGFIDTRIGVRSSWINSRLRKRYGNAPNIGNMLPLGQQPPALIAGGTSPPPAALSGRPILGCLIIRLAIRTPGALGGAEFTWTSDGSDPTLTTAQGPSVVQPLVALAGTGMSIVFPIGTYAADNVYQAAPPVPETVLGWITNMVTLDAFQKRGVNPADPQLVLVKGDVDTALAEIKEAADSKEGLFDLPVCEDLDTAVTTGGPLGYSETSPYVWTDVERQVATTEDSIALGSSR